MVVVVAVVVVVVVVMPQEVRVAGLASVAVEEAVKEEVAKVVSQEELEREVSVVEEN